MEQPSEPEYIRPCSTEYQVTRSPKIGKYPCPGHTSHHRLRPPCLDSRTLSKGSPNQRTARLSPRPRTATGVHAWNSSDLLRRSRRKGFLIEACWSELGLSLQHHICIEYNLWNNRCASVAGEMPKPEGRSFLRGSLDLANSRKWVTYINQRLILTLGPNPTKTRKPKLAWRLQK